MSSNLQAFCEQLKVPFANFELLKEALTHRSFLNETGNNELKHNERLEFLGDAVLELVVTKYLFHRYPERPEGELTSFRAALVRTESLAEAAKNFHYGDFIYMSRGEERTGGRSRQAILANTYEAVLGAMYLDRGYDTCTDFVKRSLLVNLDTIVAKRLDIDPKSKLQELAQDTLKITPIYELKSEVGPDHDKIFTMVVSLSGIELATGEGRSKQEAEQQAAANTLAAWQKYEKQVVSGKITSQT